MYTGTNFRKYMKLMVRPLSSPMLTLLLPGLDIKASHCGGPSGDGSLYCDEKICEVREDLTCVKSFRVPSP